MTFTATVTPTNVGDPAPSGSNGRGVVRYRFVPQPPSDVLTFVGQGRPARPTGLGTVAVSVPRIAVYRCPD